MSAAAWVFFAAAIVLAALLAITLLGAAAAQAELRAENTRLRHARLTPIHPATRDRQTILAANEAGRWDELTRDEIRALPEVGGAS